VSARRSYRFAGLALALLATTRLVAHAATGDALLEEHAGVAAPPAAAPPGEGDVSPKTGTFQYRVPIAAPPGRLGMEPELALTYSSQSALRGELAAGWSLDIPEIRRDFSDGGLGAERWLSTLQGGQRSSRSPSRRCRRAKPTARAATPPSPAIAAMPTAGSRGRRARPTAASTASASLRTSMARSTRSAIRSRR
jgi:hypothetical protein